MELQPLHIDYSIASLHRLAHEQAPSNTSQMITDADKGLVIEGKF